MSAWVFRREFSRFHRPPPHLRRDQCNGSTSGLSYPRNQTKTRNTMKTMIYTIAALLVLNAQVTFASNSRLVPNKSRALKKETALILARLNPVNPKEASFEEYPPSGAVSDSLTVSKTLKPALPAEASFED